MNQSYSAALIPLARFLNLFTARTVLDKRTLINIPYWYTVRRFILEQLNATGLFGKAPKAERLLGRDISRYVADYYAESNRRLLSLRDLPLEENGYPL